MGRFPLTPARRYVFTVLAWKDRFGSFAEELEKKHAAGISIDLGAGGRPPSDRRRRSAGRAVGRPPLAALAEKLGQADPQERRGLLLAPSTANLIASARIRPHESRHPVAFRWKPSGAPPGSRAGTSCFHARRAAMSPATVPSMT